MTRVKAFAVASLVFTSAQVLAFTPPYHINGEAYVGTATFKVSGACKVPLTKFINAQYGPVYDSKNVPVNAFGLSGVIDSTGNIVLAVINDSVGLGQSYTFQNDTTQVTENKYMISFIGEPLKNYIIVADKDCQPGTIWATPNSYLDGKNNGAGKKDVSIKQSFVGLSNLSNKCVTKGAERTCKGNKFTGAFTFKGQYITP